MALEFLPEPHIYLEDGRRIPGFHEIGRAVGLFPQTDRIPERCRTAGQHDHAAIHYAIDGDLDESTVSPETLDMVRRALDYLTSGAHAGLSRPYGGKVVAERPVSSLRGYATCPDVYWTDGHTLFVRDWKSGEPEPWHGLQLVATAEAVECTLRRDDPNSFLPVWNLACVYLKHDPLSVDILTEPETRSLVAEWTHILEHYDWLCKKGIARLEIRRSAAETQGEDAGLVAPEVVLPPSTLFDPAGVDTSSQTPPSTPPPGLFFPERNP